MAKKSSKNPSQGHSKAQIVSPFAGKVKALVYTKIPVNL